MRCCPERRLRVEEGSQSSVPRPNWKQWVVIWIAVLLAAHVWLRLQFSDFWPGRNERWGLPGYIYQATYLHETRLALTILVIASLLVWQFAGARKR